MRSPKEDGRRHARPGKRGCRNHPPRSETTVFARRPAPGDGPPTARGYACTPHKRPRQPDRLPGPEPGDRKRVVSGKSVSVRVDPGGRRIIKKKTKTSASTSITTRTTHTTHKHV